MQIHAYGLIVGLALLIFWQLAQKSAIQDGVEEKRASRIILSMIVGALIGARFWHVLTDWYLYQNNWLNIFQVWRGGLSIFGALAGGAGALWLMVKDKQKWLAWLDYLIPALPAAQIVGRWANFVNQELVGYPTNLPWGWSVELAHRPAGFSTFSHFHPLFFYEIILLGLFLLAKQNNRVRVFVLSIFSNKARTSKGQTKNTIGSEFFNFLAFYALIRLLLDFLRPNIFRSLAMSLNQWVLVGLLLYWLIWRFQLKRIWRLFLLVWFVYFATALYSFSNPPTLKSLPDHSLQTIRLGQQILQVEVVNSNESVIRGLSGRNQLPAQGMLFILPRRRQATFWMKEMLFPLDIIWIDQGKIVKISSNLPPPLPNQALDQLPLYASGQPVEMVLEVESGTADVNNWQVGDPIVPLLY